MRVGSWLVALAAVGTVIAILINRPSVPLPHVVDVAVDAAGKPLHARRPPPLRAPSWRFEAGGPITGGAAVDDAGNAYVGSHDGVLTALSPAGKPLWQVSLNSPIHGAIAFAGQRCCAGTDSGWLSCIDRDGGLAWQRDLGGPVDAGVVMRDERVYAAAGRTLWALDANGQSLWSYSAGGKIFTMPAFDADGRAYVGSQDGHVHALTEDGSPRWKFRTGGDVDSTPAVDADGSVYFGSDDGHVYGVSNDGSLRWSVAVGGYVRAGVALTRDEGLLVHVFGPRPRVILLNRSDGSVRWSFGLSLTDSAEIGSRSTPTVGPDGAIYFGTHDHYLYALTEAGEPRWKLAARSSIESGPSLGAAGSLYVGSVEGALTAVLGVGSGRVNQ